MALVGSRELPAVFGACDATVASSLFLKDMLVSMLAAARQNERREFEMTGTDRGKETDRSHSPNKSYVRGNHREFYFALEHCTKTLAGHSRKCTMAVGRYPWLSLCYRTVLESVELESDVCK
jgi:hypothetical protein